MSLNRRSSPWPLFQALFGLSFCATLHAAVTVEPNSVQVGKKSEVTLHFDQPETIRSVKLEPGAPFVVEHLRLDGEYPDYQILHRHNGIFLRDSDNNVIAAFSTDAMANNGHYDFVAEGEAGLMVYKEHDWQHKKPVGAYHTSAPALDVAASEGLVFVASGTGGLVGLDAQNPVSPLWLGSHQKLGRAIKVSAEADRVAVLNDAGIIFLLDVSNPAEPTTVSAYRSDTPLRDIVLKGDQLFALTPDEIQRLDFSAEMPQISNEGLDFGQGVNLGGERRVFIANDLAYVADWFSGIHIYDLSRPRQPELLSSFHTPGSPKGIVVRDGIAFVADDDHGLEVIDVSDPLNPKMISSLLTNGLAYTPRLVGNLLYLASHRGGFQIIDVSDVNQPKLIGEYDTEGKAWSMEVHGTVTYVADDDSGLLMFDVSDPTKPELIGQYHTGAAAEEVMVRDNIAFVAFFNDGLHILDISDPRQPRLISKLAIPGNARGLDLIGDKLYVAGWLSGVHVVDVSNVKQPKLLGSYDTRGAAWGIKVVGNNLYDMDWWGGVNVIDIADPTRPQLVGGYHKRGHVHDIAAQGNYTFVANGSNGVQVFDIKNPLNPTWTTGVSFPGQARRIVLHGKRAYVAAGDGGLAIIDISNPFNVRWLDSYDSRGEVDAVAVDNSHAYLSDSREGVIALDVRRDRPRKQTSIRRVAHDLWLDKGNLFLATDVGVEALRLNERNQFESVASFRINGSARRIDGDDNQLYVAAGRSLIRLKRKPQLEESGRLTLDEPINDLRLSDEGLLVSTRHTLITIDRQRLEEINARYPLIGYGGNILPYEGIVYLGGEETITALRPLPQLQETPEGRAEVRLTLPDTLAIGSYNLRLDIDSGTEETINNAIYVEMPKFAKPKISMEKFKKLLQQERHKLDNDQSADDPGEQK
jgi:hypothetical protein